MVGAFYAVSYSKTALIILMYLYALYVCSIDQKTSKEIKTDYGPDVDWVLRGSGSLSRGSAGAVNHHSLGIDGASGQIYGSNVSLQVFFY